MEKLLTMSKQELTRLEIIQRLEEKRMRQTEAAELMGISPRHVRRLLRAYREQGEQGLISKRRGKPSNNRLKTDVKQQAVNLLHSRYHDFGPTLAHEKPREKHELEQYPESVRKIMILVVFYCPYSKTAVTLRVVSIGSFCTGGFSVYLIRQRFSI